MSTAVPASEASRRFEAAQWRQFALITAGAIALFVGLRWLPTGTNLSHMDFRVDPKAGNAIEFCDPLNPQFIPVVEARSPVTMSLRTEGARGGGVVGQEVQAVVTLKTGSGKPVAPEDLLVTHTRPLHLLLVDPTLSDYQHVHPQPGATKGEWRFAFTPRLAGVYRIFGDFTPAATGRGLYASADLTIAPAANAPAANGRAAERSAVPTGGSNQRVERDGHAFSLSTAQTPIRAAKPIDLRFAIRGRDGAAVPLEPVMGAFAHLVAFDMARSGFAHLHPAEADLLKAPDAREPVLNFKLTIPRAGRYVVWAQVNLAGREAFVPFAIEVVE